MVEKLLNRITEWIIAGGESRLGKVWLTASAPILLAVWFAPYPFFASILITLVVFAAILLFAMFSVALAIRTRRSALLRNSQALGEIRGLKWRDFEFFVAGLLEAEGFEVRMPITSGADGGIDIHARRDNVRWIVQCKQHRNEPVGPDAARALYGVMIRTGADRALLCTSGEFSVATEDEFEGDQRLELLDGMGLVARVQNLPPEARERLNSTEAEGTLLHFARRIVEVAVPSMGSGYIRVPRCQRCGRTMILKYSNRTNQRFWACGAFPNCEGQTVALQAAEVGVLDPDRGRAESRLRAE